MPDTHATRFTDTARMIPDKVPIPLASLDDHLRTTSDHLIKLLTNKSKPIGPCVKPTTKEALLQIAKILHRDTLSSSTSKGAGKHSSTTSSPTSKGEKSARQKEYLFILIPISPIKR